QKPSAQNPERHSCAPPHDTPVVPLGTHAFVVVQNALASQSMSVAQVVEHAPRAASQRYEPQDIGVWLAMHVPCPSQICPTTWPPTQADGPHEVFSTAYCRHSACDPSHVPSGPHAAPPSGWGHWFLGSVPAAMKPHVPSAPLPFTA